MKALLALSILLALSRGSSQLGANEGETHCCLCLKSLSVLILYQLSLITASL